MFEKLNEKSIAVKAGLAALVAIAIIAAAFYTPGISINDMEAKNKTDQAALDTKLKENANLKQYESRLQDLDRQIESLKLQMEYQKSIVPDEKNADKFIMLLQETASNAGVELRRLNAKEIVNKDYYAEMPFEIEVDGPFYGMLNFFDKLAGQTRIVNVEGLTMKTLKGETKYPLSPTDSVKVTTIAKTFFSREAAPAAPAAPAPGRR